MTTQCICGADRADNARYCSACGRAVDERSAVLGAAPVTTTHVDADGLDLRFVAVAAAVLIGVFGWAITVGGGDNDGEGADSVAATTTSSTLEHMSLPPTTARPPTTTSSDAAFDERDGDAASTGLLFAGPGARIIGDGGPLLGEPTGLLLFLRASREGVAILDLDTGAFVDGVPGQPPLDPVAVVGDLLLARYYERLISLRFDELDAKPVFLLPSAPIQEVDSSHRGTDLVWVAYKEGAFSNYLLLDAADGSILDEIDYDERRGLPLGNRALTTPGLPDLVTGVGGGIYESSGGRFTRVGDGTLLAADSTRVLVRDCTAPDSCDLAWLDRRTWQPLALAVPTDAFDAVSLGEGSAWLSVIDLDDFATRARVLDLSSGEEHTVAVVAFDAYAGAGPTTSSNGRWMARVVDRGVEILDTTTDEATLIELPERLLGTAVFVDADVVG